MYLKVFERSMMMKYILRKKCKIYLARTGRNRTCSLVWVGTGMKCGEYVNSPIHRHFVKKNERLKIRRIFLLLLIN